MKNKQILYILSSCFYCIALFQFADKGFTTFALLTMTIGAITMLLASKKEKKIKMDQNKIGKFLKELRKEKSLTQEKIAEVFNVSRRTISRWESGENMPDLSILVEIADYYNVDLREIFEGERKENKMDKELESTVIQVAEYSNIEKTKATKVVMAYSLLGMISLITNQVLDWLNIDGTFLAGFAKGATAGLALCSMLFAFLFASGRLTKIKESKSRILERKNK